MGGMGWVGIGEGLVKRAFPKGVERRAHSHPPTHNISINLKWGNQTSRPKKSATVELVFFYSVPRAARALRHTQWRGRG